MLKDNTCLLQGVQYWDAGMQLKKKCTTSGRVIMAKTPLERWKEEKNKKDGKVTEEDLSYKKIGEPCNHPPVKRVREGGYVICLLCGRILNDK